MRISKRMLAGAAAATFGLVCTYNFLAPRLLQSANNALTKNSKVSAATTATAVNALFTSSLTGDLNTDIQEDAGGVEVAVSVTDLDHNKTYNAGETGVVFHAASTAKLIAVAAYLHEVETGQATLGEYIEGDTAQDLIQRMLEVSDNDAWAAIDNFLGDEQQSYAASIGLTSFTGGDTNTISAADEAKLLQLLYQGSLLSSQDRQLMLGYMQQADGTDLIKAALPSGATVYHKYGLLDGNLDDTAIVSYRGHHFALVIYTKNDDGTTDDYDTRVALIHELTQTVLHDMTR